MLKLAEQSSDGKALSQVVLMSLSLLNRTLHQSPVDSALLGAEHPGWPLAATKAAETQQQSKTQLPASHRLHRYAICPDWNHLGYIRLGNVPSLLAYLLFIQSKCYCNKSYTLDCTDEIVCQNLGWSLISRAKLNISTKISLDFHCAK